MSNRNSCRLRIFYSALILTVLIRASCTVAPTATAPIPTEAPLVTVVPVFLVFPTNEALAAQTVEVATTYANTFQSAYKVKLDPSRAIGLDGNLVSGETSGRLVSTIAPVSDTNQFYGSDRQVFGYIGFDSTTQPLKGLGQKNAYLIACNTTAQECVAVPESGEPIPVNAEFETLSTIVDVPFATYEKGSIKACFTVHNVKVCIVVF